MFTIADITIDALLGLPRVEVDKCKILSRSANAFIEKHWIYILRHYVDGDLVNEVTNAYEYIGAAQITRTTPIDAVELERYRKMNRAEGWTEYADKLTKVMLYVVKFAKRVRGFRALERVEQIRLLKKQMFVISTISISQYYNSDVGLLATSWLGGRALPVNAFACSDEGDRQFANRFLSGIQMLAAMQLSNTVIALFSSFALLQNSPHGQVHVEQIKTALIWMLGIRVSPSHAWVEYARLIDDILPFFDSLSEQHVKCVSSLRTLDPTQLQLPELYKELFVSESR